MEINNKVCMSNAKKTFCLWDYFIATIFILTSDAVFWHIKLTPGVSITFFLIVSFLTFRKNYGKYNNSIYFFFITLLFIIGNYIFYLPTFKNNSSFGYIVCSLGTFYCLASYDFYYFRKIITDVVYVICGIGIVLFVLFEFNLLPIKQSTVGGIPFLTFGPYIYGWDSPVMRFSGIWHEPGACQIVLNFILWIHLDCIQSWKWERKQLKKVSVIFIASILTESTGGYISIMLLLLAIVSNIKLKVKHKKTVYITICFFIFILIYLLYASDAIQNKLLAGSTVSESKIIRTLDMTSMWKLSIERPFLGYGLGSWDFYLYSSKLGNISSSSGILKFAACCGWIWVISNLYFIWKGARKITNYKSAIFMLIAYLVLMMNEDFMEYPISSIFLYSFASYINPNYIKDENNINNNSNIQCRKDNKKMSYKH